MVYRVLLFRLSVVSKKLILFLFALIVILKPFSENILHTSFFMFSISFGVVLETPKPSSLYRRKLFSCFCVINFKIYAPTCSQVSAPSYPHIFMSKKLWLCFPHAFPELKNSDFLACIIVSILSLLIVSNFDAEVKAFSSKFCEIEG